MDYELLNVITDSAIFTANVDGSINACNISVQVGIVGSPEGKFIQTDKIPAFDIPASTTSANQPAYINTQAQAYVTETYPNT